MQRIYKFAQNNSAMRLAVAMNLTLVSGKGKNAVVLLLDRSRVLTSLSLVFQPGGGYKFVAHAMPDQRLPF